MVDLTELVYQSTAADPVAARGDFTTTLDISGPPILTRQLSGANPLMALKSIHVTTEGLRLVAPVEQGTSIRYDVDRAHVDGMFGGQAFDFDFDANKPPENIQEKALEIAWGLAMSGRAFTLGPKGEYLTADAKADAHAEAFALLIDVPVRLPESAIAVGEEWTAEWTGARKQRDTGATFEYRQTGKIDRIEPGSSPRAHISFSTNATLRFPGKPSPQNEESRLEATGTMVFDTAAGLPVVVDGTGTITTHLKTSGVKLVRGITTKYAVQDVATESKS